MSLLTPTFSFYVARRFMTAFMAVFGTCFAIIFAVDLLEMLRRTATRDIGGGTITWIVLQRAPAFSEQVLPFAVLFGAMMCFLVLSRRSEIAVARAAGISAWQIVAPAVIVALLIGVFATAVYNPISAEFKERADRMEAGVFTTGGDTLATIQTQNGIWSRQNAPEGSLVMRADGGDVRSLDLKGVTIYSFDRQNRFAERIEADRAQLVSGKWTLSNARVVGVNRPPTEHDTYLVATNITPEQLRDQLTTPDSVPFWELKDRIAASEAAGIPTARLRLQRQLLLARPVLLAAMVLIAASVSLGLFRSGGIGPMVTGGVLAGFLLYVFTKIAGDLGTSGIVDPAVSAWLPAVAGALAGFMVLLVREDG